MKNRFPSNVLILPFIIILCSLFQQSMAQRISERIPLKPGPEDMVLDTLHGDPGLIISCCGRREADKPYGEIVLYKLSSGEQFVMERLNEPVGILFRPHGIYLDGDMLYVISHEREPDYHPVLVYRVDGKRLNFVELIHTRLQHSPNALVCGTNGEIYLVNDSGKRGSLWEKALKLKRASVVKLGKNGEGRWEAKTVADNMGYPAGVNRIGNRLYVGDAVLHKLHVYEIRDDGLLPAGEISKLKGNDNIRVYEGQLLIPGHVKPLKFISHAKNPQKKSPVEVFLVDPESGDFTSLYATDGSTISGGSSAIIYDKHLYICQVFEPYILKVEMEP
jgi:arylesterase / paraoxonase